jgi:hypothetical protein
MSMNCLKLTSSLCVGALLLAACGTPKETTASGEESSTSSPLTTTDETPTDSNGMTSVGETTTTTGMSGSQTMGEESSSTMPDTTVTDPTTGPAGCPDPEGQDNNLECTDASGCGCKSGFCFLVPILGGWCGECLVDTDCDAGGCSVPNPIAMTGATCNMGEPGAGCMTDDICTDPANGLCGTLLEVPGIISVKTCGECAANADCLDGALPNCTPVFDVANFTGKFECVEDNSVPQDGGCNLTDDGMGAPVGNAACVSGFCGEANVMGLLKVGICGECNSDADCAMGTCSDPIVDLEMGALVGSVCG